MSTEKENELNEQELWDLLKDHEETDLSRPVKKKTEKKPEKTHQEKPDEEKAESKTIITEKRKKALVWYLVGLFGIAFVVVLLSLFLNSGGKGPGNTDSTGEGMIQTQELNDRIRELEQKNADLQAENRELQKKILEQQEMMDGLNLMIDEMSNSLEYVEGNQYLDADADLIARKIHAYETLVKAQAAFIHFDEDVLEAAMEELADDLDLMSQDAINAYYMVTEYMEQPYLGQ